MTRQRKYRDIRKIFQISVLSGIFGQIFSTLAGSGSAFLTKFAIMLNATPLHFAILSAIGQVSQIFQPLGAFVTKKRTKRKGIVLAIHFIGCGSVLCFGILPFVFSLLVPLFSVFSYRRSPWTVASHLDSPGQR